MSVFARYGLSGIGALGLLTAVHWLRGLAFLPSPLGDYLLGILPNFAAAIAIAFVALSIWSDQNRDADFASTKRAFLFTAAMSGAGLLAWEFFQQTSDRLVFDPHDIGATLVGLGAAGLLFHALTRQLRTGT